MLAELRNFLEKDLKFPTKSNPDFLESDFTVFKMEDGRQVLEKHLSKPIKYPQKIFIIATDFLTEDAQNLLLKAFEEPSGQTVFFLLCPNIKTILPTLLSRMMTFKVAGLFLKTESEAGKFFSASVPVRLKIIQKKLAELSDEEIGKIDIINFVRDLETYLKEKKDTKAKVASVTVLEKALSYLNDESPSVKVILEHLAVVL